MIEVSFEHWKYEFSEEDLQYGSSHFGEGEARKNLRDALDKARSTGKAKRITKDSIDFTESHIICANESFPEAAIADPIADLEVWNEWRSGVRIFPYSGQYSKLSITNQPGKGSSPSSIGVVGEIMAGLFGQAIISPWVLVRVIRRWPDFIFYTNDGRYAFLEAKAFTSKNKNASVNSLDNVLEATLGECLLNAVRHQTIDPVVKIFYSFTQIKEIQPNIRLAVTFLELDVPDSRRNNTKISAPQPLIDGLAERAIQKAINQYMTENRLDELRRNQIDKIKSKIKFLANNLIEEVLNDFKSLSNHDSNSKAYSFKEMDIDIRRIEKSIDKQVRDFKIPEVAEDMLLLPSYIQRDDGFVRRLSFGSLYRRDLRIKEQVEVNKEWESNWKLANKPWKENSDKTYWRFGSVAFSLVQRKSEF